MEYNKKKFPTFKNYYFILRHGESEANVKGIINSDPSIGIERYGLTQKGKKQVYNNCLKALKLFLKDLVIVSSDFRRARETAEVAKDVFIYKKNILFTKALRERSFGNLEGTSNKNYDRIWELDKNEPNHKKFNNESAEEVKERVLRLISKIENKFENKKILLISHGDVLQILQVAMLGTSPSNHRDIKHLDTGEIRRLV